MTTDVVTVFLRHGPAVLLLERSSEVGSYAGQWGAVAGHAEGDPDEAARRELREEAGVTDATIVRRGDPFEVHDPDHGTWRVHPFLVDAESRSAATNWETASHEWVPPTEIRRRDTVPDLWRSYDAVRPTVETVAGDDEHGSAYVSLRALDVLRDEAALADDYGDAAAVARDLRDARQGMAVVRNRVNRAMHEADRTPASVEASALAVAREAVDADDRAAARAAAELDDASAVFTLSRSGTVLAALRAAGPDRVVVAESRPGGEGVPVAETLADEAVDVTLTSDANVPAAVADCDAVLAGSDAVFPDGTVVNKVGTRAAALAARDAGVPVLVACAADKIATEQLPADEMDDDPPTLYDGDADLTVAKPVFEAVPGRLVDAVVTEDGRLDGDAAAAAVRERRGWADWE
ncbi:NUDIX domain-containing protein [Halobacterium jilantaiense]|uniref:Translation initiation factor 2B subunit, eIF-2B alpha/beta/delta family n=1 Tax=Halobacterium jilantaiense TaxID=355548 RepID=A0A1I0PDU1_9EURY|nr:NUDIX domain-containing protein [Halobacterium jilantaiense]SEW12455.1 Translation initiation factor 2B subunit, eIF-2B alpha/beta/delta family [Halobacterium jilantaiense]